MGLGNLLSWGDDSRLGGLSTHPSRQGYLPTVDGLQLRNGVLFLIPSLLKRHAHTVGVNRAEFLGPPRLGLQRTVGMHLAAPLLVFGVQCLNTLHGETHHGLVADLPCQDFVVHASDVEVRLAAVDACISWRSSVAKSFLEAADLRPPLQRFRGVGSGENRDSAL